MKEDLKEFLSFNKAERRGIFILSSIVVLLLFYNYFGPFRNSKTNDFLEFENMIVQYEGAKDSMALLNKPQKRSYKKAYSKAKRKYNLKVFNPNTISKDDWISMGLTSKQASSIIKFVSKGGKFYKPDDIRKLYCLSSAECDMIVPYVEIEDIEIQKDASYVQKKEYLQIELNSATQGSLELVNGIGHSIAKGILKYRNILGGYVQLEQLKEVYHIDSAKYENIKNNFIISTDSINKININTADYYTLKRHPYISKQNAYEIVQYRNKKGKYKNIEDILKVKGVTDSLYQKIYLYFALSETNTQ
jgi:competence ComEA-like helix-hairpin-helix protein